MDWTAFVDGFTRLSPAAIMALVILGVMWVMVKGLLPALRAQTEAQSMANQQQLLIRQSYAELIERAEVVYKRELAELQADLKREQEARRVLEARVSAAESEAAKLRAELAVKSEELETAQAEIAELRECNDSVSAKVQVLQKQNAELKEQLAAVEADRKATAEERDEANKRVSELEAEVARLKSRVEELREHERQTSGSQTSVTGEIPSDGAEGDGDALEDAA